MSISIPKQGSIADSKNLYDEVIIMGMDELPLKRSNNIDFDPVVPTPEGMATWGGAVPPTFSLNWDIVAGISELVPTREALYEQIKLVQSLASPSKFIEDPPTLLAPPRCILHIFGYIYCSGVIKESSVTPRKPWIKGELSGGGGQLPSAASFSIEFLPMRGYDPTLGRNLVKQEKTVGWQQEQVAATFYTGP